MTANRWWVRWGARWAARLRGAQSYIQMASLGVTAFSTFSLVLQAAGLGRFVPAIAGLGIIGTFGFAWLYAEGGVWNQVQLDTQELSNNYAGPTMRIDDELIGLAVFAAVHGREPTEEEAEVIAETVDGGYRELRDGIDINGEEAEA